VCVRAVCEGCVQAHHSSMLLFTRQLICTSTAHGLELSPACNVLARHVRCCCRGMLCTLRTACACHACWTGLVHDAAHGSLPLLHRYLQGLPCTGCTCWC
jgi:hypothetical protein